MTDPSPAPIARPPFDPELAQFLPAIAEALPTPILPEHIQAMRDMPLAALTPEMIDEAGLETRDLTIEGHLGAAIEITIFQPKGRTGTGPGFYFVHGGGMIFGNRMGGVASTFDWLTRYDGVAVTVEYRLAPEHPDPTPVEDCYAGLLWVVEHADELGIDPSRLVVLGGSAGAGLAAGVALLARDRQGPPLAGSLLMYPMLDDRDATVSSRQFDGCGVWDRGSNHTGWNALLGDRRGTDDVSIYAAPARATDLGGLPPTFIDCGSAEVFRDEDVAYASAIWAAGGECELHVWPGGYHAFDGLVPQAGLSRLMVEARDNWIRRLLG
ncbi:MAG: alpha/beta hydrolase [Ilumatobacteraceae bacterium]